MFPPDMPVCRKSGGGGNRTRVTSKPKTTDLQGQRSAETCPGCGGPADDNWFDRSLCPCGTGIGTMHTRCVECGYALDGCPYDNPGLPRVSGTETKP